MAHTDIVSAGWIARLPPKLRAFALLARLDRPIGTWLLFLPGLWGILLPAHGPAAGRERLALLFALGSLVMRAAGCVVNDMWDRDIDRQVARTAGRPLASGALSLAEAGAFLCLLLLCGLAVLLCLPPLCWLLGTGSLLLVALYPLAKRVTWWPQLVMGFTFGFGAPMGYAATAGRIDAAWALLYAAAILWDLGFDTIYGFQDLRDDALAGVKSTSRLMADQPRRFVGAGLRGVAGRTCRGGRRRRIVLAVLGGAAAAGLAVGATGDDARHPRCRALPAPVPRQPRGGAGGGGGVAGRADRAVSQADRTASQAEGFIAAQTQVGTAPLVPEIRLRLASEITPIWQASEDWLAEHGVEPPFWAFAWPGGQAMARHVLDHPGLVAGKRVLDFAAGGGIVAIACALAGAARVEAAEIDRLAVAAIGLNASLNQVSVATLARDVVGEASRWDLILCGDVCYEARMTRHILPWLRRLAADTEILLADPGRAYRPTDGVAERARYDVPTSLELEDRTLRPTTLYRLQPIL